MTPRISVGGYLFLYKHSATKFGRKEHQCTVAPVVKLNI